MIGTRQLGTAIWCAWMGVRDERYTRVCHVLVSRDLSAKESRRVSGKMKSDRFDNLLKERRLVAELMPEVMTGFGGKARVAGSQSYWSLPPHVSIRIPVLRNSFYSDLRIEFSICLRLGALRRLECATRELFFSLPINPPATNHSRRFSHPRDT